MQLNICALHDLYILVGDGFSSSSFLFMFFFKCHTSSIHVFCVLYVSMKMEIVNNK